MEEKTMEKARLFSCNPELPPKQGVHMEEGDRDGSYSLCRKGRLSWDSCKGSRVATLRFD